MGFLHLLCFFFYHSLITFMVSHFIISMGYQCDEYLCFGPVMDSLSRVNHVKNLGCWYMTSLNYILWIGISSNVLFYSSSVLALCTFVDNVFFLRQQKRMQLRQYSISKYSGASLCHTVLSSLSPCEVLTVLCHLIWHVLPSELFLWLLSFCQQVCGLKISCCIPTTHGVCEQTAFRSFV